MDLPVKNALEQAKHFTATTDVTALTITKLDGTAKGGVVLAIANQFKIPVKFMVWEKKWKICWCLINTSLWIACLV
jgi:signal recognition particle GTPase